MSDQPLASLHATVRGRVQGVGYREFVLTRARSLNLRGYARNLPDGASVEVVAEGAPDDLEALLGHLRSGPRSSRVDTVEAHWGTATGHPAGFGIR